MAGKWGRIEWSTHVTPKGSQYPQSLRARLRTREVSIPLSQPWELLGEGEKFRVRALVRESLIG